MAEIEVACHTAEKKQSVRGGSCSSTSVPWAAKCSNLTLLEAGTASVRGKRVQALIRNLLTLISVYNDIKIPIFNTYTFETSLNLFLYFRNHIAVPGWIQFCYTQ